LVLFPLTAEPAAAAAAARQQRRSTTTDDDDDSSTTRSARPRIKVNEGVMVESDHGRIERATSEVAMVSFCSLATL